MAQRTILQRTWRVTKIFLWSLLLIVLGAYATLWYAVNRSVSPYLYSEADLPHRSTAVILGAQVQSNGQPSQVLTSRLEAGIQLYKEGKVDRLLMSGDSSSDAKHYDEVGTMRDYAVAHGVPAGKIDTDPLGLRTYDSCYRLLTVEKLADPVIVSQADHVIRAVYTCRSLGVNAVGVRYTSDIWSSDVRTILRSQAALVLAWLDVHVLHPTPPDPSA